MQSLMTGGTMSAIPIPRSAESSRYVICIDSRLVLAVAPWKGSGRMMVSKNMMWGFLAVAAGAGLAAVLMPQARNRWLASATDESDRIDEASEDSFPASDPPSQSAPSAATPGPVS